MTENSKPTPDDAPYVIHALQPQGFGYVAATFEGNEFGAQPGRVPYGGELTVTRALRDANRDRNGVSWLEHDSAAQDAEYGPDRHRFGYGPVPASIRADIAARRRATLEEARRTLLANNRGAREADSAARNLAHLDAELSALDAGAQNS